MNHPETQTQHNRVQNMQEVGLPLPHFGARLGEIVAILRGNKDDINNVLRGYCSSSYQQHPLIDCIRYHGQTFWRNVAGPQSTVFFLRLVQQESQCLRHEQITSVFCAVAIIHVFARKCLASFLLYWISLFLSRRGFTNEKNVACCAMFRQFRPTTSQIEMLCWIVRANVVV